MLKIILRVGAGNFPGGVSRCWFFRRIGRSRLHVRSAVTFSVHLAGGLFTGRLSGVFKRFGNICSGMAGVFNSRFLRKSRYFFYFCGRIVFPSPFGTPDYFYRLSGSGFDDRYFLRGRV